MTKGIFTGEDVSINGIVLNRIDDSGCSWALSDIDGWWGLPDLEAYDDPKSYIEDGSYFAAGRYNPRSITITGYIIPSSSGVQAVVDARNTLNAALNLLRSEGTLQVNETPFAKFATVQISGRPLTEFNSINNVLEFNIQLKANDPRKFYVGQEIVNSNLPTKSSGRRYPKLYPFTYGIAGSNGEMTAVNQGNYDTDGMFRVYGPVENPGLTHKQSGKTLQFDALVGIDEYLDIDLKNRLAFFKGNKPARSSLLPSSQWFSLQPGQNTIAYTGFQAVAAQQAHPNLYNRVTNPDFADVLESGLVDGLFTSGDVSGLSQVISFDAPGNHRSVTIPRTGIEEARIIIGGSPEYYTQLSPSSDTYAVSVWVKPLRDAQIQLGLVDPDGIVSTTFSDVISLNAGTWTRASAPIETGTSLEYAELTVLWKAQDPGFTDEIGDTLTLSMAMVDSSTQLYDYFDGNDLYASWTGTPYASMSYSPQIEGVPETVVELSFHSAWIY